MSSKGDGKQKGRNMKPQILLQWDGAEALYAMFSTRDPLDPKMVERIKELPGVDSVCSPHGRYSLMLYKGRLFRWEEIQDSIYALFSDNEVTK